MYTRNCAICNIGFKTKSQNKINCDSHKGYSPKLYSLINNELHKKCLKCLTVKKSTEFYIKHKGRLNSWCKSCFDGNQYLYQKNKATNRKLILIKQMGGKCSNCGYHKNLAGLVFHHTNKDKKQFSLDSRTLANMSLKEIENEIKICIILCHNCHMEEHYPEFNDLL